MKLDDFEQESENNISGYESASDKKKSIIKNIIKRAQKKSVNLRVNCQDLELIKRRAAQEGIPYQTLISSILHKYVTDQLVDERNILKSVQLLTYRS